MDITTSILGGIVIAIISGIAGKCLWTNDRVRDTTCKERQIACSALLVTEVKSLTASIDELKEAVKELRLFKNQTI